MNNAEEQVKTVWEHQDGFISVVEVTREVSGSSRSFFRVVGPYGVSYHDFRTKDGAIARAIRIARRVKASWRKI